MLISGLLRSICASHMGDLHGELIRPRFSVFSRAEPYEQYLKISTLTDIELFTVARPRSYESQEATVWNLNLSARDANMYLMTYKHIP